MSCVTIDRLYEFTVFARKWKDSNRFVCFHDPDRRVQTTGLGNLSRFCISRHYCAQHPAEKQCHPDGLAHDKTNQQAQTIFDRNEMHKSVKMKVAFKVVFTLLGTFTFCNAAKNMDYQTTMTDFLLRSHVSQGPKSDMELKSAVYQRLLDPWKLLDADVSSFALLSSSNTSTKGCVDDIAETLVALTRGETWALQSKHKNSNGNFVCSKKKLCQVVKECIMEQD